MANSLSQEPASIVPLLSRALHRIRSTPPRIIASPATQPRRAAVAIIIRISPSPTYAPQRTQPSNKQNEPASTSASPENVPPPTLTEFFQLDWVNAPGAQAEILFLRRDKPEGSDGGRLSGSGPRSSEAHVAFPGGKTDEGDEGGLYTAMRQTWEEIGLDLAESAYTPIGQLDDREITTSLGKRLLMILSPFVFLQLTPHTTPVDPAPGTTLHWVPIAELLPFPEPVSVNSEKRSRPRAPPRPRWSTVTVDASSRLAPRHSTMLRLLVRLLVGSMQFPAIIISPSVSASAASLASPVSYPSSDEKARDAAHVERGAALEPTLFRRRRRPSGELKLWGLSLGMTLDLLAHMAPPSVGKGAGAGVSMGAFLPPDSEEMMRVPVVAPSLTSVFPRFSYPDVNFWIWVFGKRYRDVIRGWEASVRAGGTNDRRINWTGSALTTFYAAVRKALIVVIVLRAFFVLTGLLFGGWLLFMR